jgi:hypothetical protein
MALLPPNVLLAAFVLPTVIARSEATKQSILLAALLAWIASLRSQ